MTKNRNTRYPGRNPYSDRSKIKKPLTIYVAQHIIEKIGAKKLRDAMRVAVDGMGEETERITNNSRRQTN